MAENRTRRRIWLAVFIAAGLALIGFGIAQISFRVDMLKLLPAKLPEVQGLELYLTHFSKPDELIVVMKGEDPDGLETAAGSLARWLRDRPELVREVVDHAPWEDDPAGFSEIIAFALLNRAPGEWTDLEAALSPGESAKRLEQMLEEMTDTLSPEVMLMGGYDPFGLAAAAMGEGGVMGMMNPDASEFVSADGTLRVLYVEAAGARDRANYQDLIGWIGAVRAETQAWRASESASAGVGIQFTGEPAFVAEISAGMERDMKVSGVSTLLLVAAVFWLWYRRLKPLLALMSMLMLIFVATLGLAGLSIRELTVMNVGFASILIGLSVDYGVLIYQATLRSPGDSSHVRGESRKGILCAAATTAVAFAALGVSSLPGLSELGILVAIGIGVGSVTMLGVYAAQMGRISRAWPVLDANEPVSAPERFIFNGRTPNALAWVVLGLVTVAAGVLVTRGFPKWDGSSATMRPRSSEAYDALDEIYAGLMDEEKMGSLVIQGKDGEEVRRRLRELESKLEAAQSAGDLKRYLLPTPFVPVAANHQSNLDGAAMRLAAEEPRLLTELDEAGFSTEAGELLRGVFKFWRSWKPRETPVMPESRAARWMLDRLVTRTDAGDLIAAGQIIVGEGADLRGLQAPGVLLADWDQTMHALTELIPKEIFRILALLVVLMVAMLLATFRRFADLGWVFLSISLSVVTLLGAMSLLGWTWNFFNIAALLLTFGAGLDYSIHLLLGFRQTGDVSRVQRGVGQALLVCALSTVAGFGSLSWASNLGLASLGRVCALALLVNALVAIFLLPKLWEWASKRVG